MTVDEALAAAFAALRRRDGAGTLLALEYLPDDVPPDVTARADAWRAQALRQLGRLDEAERAAARAVQAAKRAGDVDGVTQIRELHASILASLAATRASDAERAKDAVLADVPVEILLEGAEGAERARRLVRKAGALVDAGRGTEAVPVASQARDEAVAAGDRREEVVALLTLARCDDPHRWIREAHRVADDADDMNLITAVAKAARAAGVELDRPVWGS